MNPTPSFPSLWNLQANPLFRRYAVARLRPVRLMVGVLLPQVIAGFWWLVCFVLSLDALSGTGLEAFYDGFVQAIGTHGRGASLVAWLPVLIVQGLFVIFKGTFSVATGVAREGNEGMMDAILLTPVPVGHRIVGQLFGLPVYENLLALLLVPWAMLGAWVGGLAPLVVAKVYLLFATSALFHHAIGLVAGTIIRQKTLAGTLSQAVIVLVHFVLPALGRFGIGMIAYFAVEPAITQVVATSVPELVWPHGLFAADRVLGSVRIFRWEFALPGYHWLITVSGLAALLWAQAHRWRDPSSQFLGKVGTTVVAGWLLLLACGEFVPKFESGAIARSPATGDVPAMVGRRPQRAGVGGGNFRNGGGRVVLAACRAR